ncbi:uncharacterized protein LOC121995168 [Zingiber officinale]|uniref:uncharacterized protein LOC121995168 n=1 Tax=Zingiber officinale TaxID=94328 RepID=UPI001C4D5B9C|nr:uncharacterized protein LOC121995168 [Zingiber officinale]
MIVLKKVQKMNLQNSNKLRRIPSHLQKLNLLLRLSKKESSSSEEDEDDSSEESSDDEPSKQQQANKAIQASKKSNSSDSSEESSNEESEDEEPLKTPKKNYLLNGSHREILEHLWERWPDDQYCGTVLRIPMVNGKKTTFGDD